MGAREVAAGAQWLDENFPGWEREIDLGTFELASCQNCVLGQALRKKALQNKVVNGFYYGVTLGARNTAMAMGDWASTHGFCAKYEDEVLWRELIKERFNTGNLSDIGED